MSAGRVIVVGGGVAGCTAAHRLRRSGHEVVLVEAADRIGGRTTTVERDGFALDAGAVYLLSIYERTQAILTELGADDDVRGWSPPAGLWDGERMQRVRYDFLPSFLGLRTLGVRDKLRLLRKGVGIVARRAPDPYDTDSCAEFDTGETIDAWSRRELGDAVHEHLVRPWVEPAFGVGCERLATPFLHGVLKKAYRTRFTIPAAGMGDLCARLVRDIDVRTSAPATRIETREDGVRVELDDGALEADGVVVATDGPTAGRLLDGTLDDEATALLDGAPYSTMVHVTAGWERDPWPDAPVDMALPIGPGRHPVVGIILLGRKNPGAVPAGAQAVDAYLDETASRTSDDATARDLALRAITEMLGPSSPPSFVEVFRYERALALAPPGHYRRMQRLRSLVPPRVALAGDYLAHLGVETAVVTGEAAATRLAQNRSRERVV